MAARLKDRTLLKVPILQESPLRFPLKRFATAIFVLVLVISFLGYGVTQTKPLLPKSKGPGADASLAFIDGTLRTSLKASVSDLVPGDSVARTLSLENMSAGPLASISINVTDLVAGKDFQDSDVLELRIERCDAYYQRCQELPLNGSTGLVIADIAGPATEPHGIDFLRVTRTFDAAMPNRFKGAEARIIYGFTATAAPLEAPTRSA